MSNSKARTSKSKPLLLILSAPSGTGKTTLARRLVAANPGAIFSVSYTNRGPRGGERDGVDYHFVSEERFQQMIAAGEFVEWAHVHGHHYGTPKSVIAEAAARGALAIFDIDVQGGESIKKQHPEAVRALVLPPSLAELERRLRARSTDDDATVRRRLHAARIEIRLALSAGYEYWVVNDDLERAYADLEAIVRAEGCRAGRRPLASDLGQP
jgi:guanylate kinase